MTEQQSMNSNLSLEELDATTQTNRMLRGKRLSYYKIGTGTQRGKYHLREYQNGKYFHIGRFSEDELQKVLSRKD